MVRRRTLFIGVIAILGLIAAACGGAAIDQPSSPEPTSTSTGKPASEAEAPEGVPMVDTSIASVPLNRVVFDTFSLAGAVPLSEASEELILRLRDAIPPLTNPRYDDVSGGDWLKPTDLVLGYASGGEVYAYPFKILNFHEIVNDVFDGVSILISYCPLCRSAIVYDRRLNGQVLTFGNTSALYENDLVMYDHQTGSYWYQTGGEAIVGALTRSRLDVIPSLVATWAEWRSIHPETSVLSRNTGFNRDYTRDPFEGYDNIVDAENFPFPVSERGRDPRLNPAQEVLGVELGGIRVAYPLDNLGDAAINDLLGDIRIVVFSKKEGPSGAAYLSVANGQELTFEFDDGGFIDVETGSIWNLAGVATQGPLKGAVLEPIPSRFTFWFSLVATFPDIEVYQP